MITHFRAIISEFLGKLGTDYAFKKKENFAFVLAHISLAIFKGNRRGSLLLVYLYVKNGNKDKAIKTFGKYIKRSDLLKSLARTVEKYQIKSKYLSPRIFSLTQTWNKKSSYTKTNPIFK